MYIRVYSMASLTFNMHFIAIRNRLETKAQVRFKFTKTYKEPHLDEKLLRAAVEPMIRPERKPQWETCFNHKIVGQSMQGNHPYLSLLSQDFKEDLRNNRLMCFYHRQFMTAFDYKRMRNKLFHAGFLLRKYSPFVTRLTFENTKYSPLLTLSMRNTEYVFCKEPNVSELLNVTKSMPHLVLLCGVIDDMVLTRDELQNYAQLPSLDVLRCQLSHTLSLFGSSLVSTISYPSSALSSSLDQLAAGKKTNNES